MNLQNESDIIVDAVITWVDGNDPVHRSKMETYVVDKNTINTKSVRMRYDQVNEIEFAVKSILKYAKFVRKIFIVTDNQTPEFLKDKELIKKKYSQVVVVDHKNIFKDYEQYLPIFNSLSIESMLFRIPDLAEHFIYFNDDFFIANNTTVGDFFRDGKPVIRGFWTKFYEDIWHKRIKSKYQELTNTKKLVYSHNRGLQMPAKWLGLKKYVHIDHTVAALRKSTFVDYFSENPQMLDRNIKHRFRHIEQYSIQSLANHLEIKNNSFTLIENYQLVYFQNYKKPFLWIKFKLNNIEKNTNKLFLCMQSLSQCPQEKLTYIKNWLQAKYA